MVTAFHVVAGCAAVRVGYQGVAERDARIVRVAVDADLALLEVADAPGGAALELAEQTPEVGAVVHVYGFALGQATRENRRLMVTDANRSSARLRDALNDAAREDLRRISYPSLDTEVLRTDGNLLPGHSGAPLIDWQGRVVAVGSGGLERGTAGVGWAVRAAYVRRLPDAPAQAGRALPAPGPTSFSFAAPAVPGADQVRCGDLAFVRARQRSLGQLVASSDDQLGYHQIAATLDPRPGAFDNLLVDVWTETHSGAGVALPAGARPVASPSGDCVASLVPGVLEMRIGGTALPPPRIGDPAAMQAWVQAMQWASAAFEARAIQEFVPFIGIDPRFSYPVPQSHPTMMVMRRDLAGQRPNAPAHNVFETLLATPTAFVGVAAVNRDWRYAQSTPPEMLRLWITAALGVHLSTVPSSMP